MLCCVMLYYYATLRYPDPFIIWIIIRRHVDVEGVEGVYRKKYGHDRMDIKQLRLRFSHRQPRETATIATTMTI